MLKAFDHIIKLKYAFCMLWRELVLLFGVKAHLFMPIHMWIMAKSLISQISINRLQCQSRKTNLVEISDWRFSFTLYLLASLWRCVFFSYRKCHEIYSTQCTPRSNHCQMRMKKNATLCTLFIYWKRNKNVMCPDQMFVESIHLERSVSTICAVKMKWKKCVAKMNHLKNVWCILHVICNIKPSNIWHGYGCAINRNCKCLHWIKWE